MKKFVAYYRVSTARQGESGLGLEAQQSSVASYLANVESELVGEYVEVESGKKSQRPQLEAAIAQCKKEKATLLIAKLDRLARNVHFISGLMNGSMDFLALDMPHANRLTIHIMAAVAEEESSQIAARTKAALQAAKARGVVLGKHSKVLAAENRKAAQERDKKVLPVIEKLQSEGVKTLTALAHALNAEGYTTAQGKKWYPVSVKRVLERAA